MLEIANQEPPRNIIYQSEHFEVTRIDWEQGCLSTLHNHGWSQCSVSILSGVFENTLHIGGKIEIHRWETGQTMHMPIGSRHELRCVVGPGQTVNVYTPKLEETSDLGKFSFKENQEKDFLQLGSATELLQLKMHLQWVREQSVSTDSPYFMNQLFSGVLPQSLLASELISQTKTTMATVEASPIFSKIEALMVESLGEVIGWPSGQREGVPVPGGSAANFMAVHLARHKKFPEFKNFGMSGKSFKVLASSEAHYSLKKACVALGLGANALVTIAVDEQGRMQAAHLENKLKELQAADEVPLMVCATSGTTVLGAFDPIDQIAAICQKYGVWLHVDAAWGGPSFFSKRLRHLCRGLELADSVTFDAHKLFGADLTCSFFLNRHAGLLLQANDVSGGEYLFHINDEQLDRGRISWQCGRRADALSFWTIWKSFGTAGLGDFVDRLLDVRDESVEWIKKQDRLRLIADADYLNICLRVLPPSAMDPGSEANWSRHVREVLKQKNLAMVNYSLNSEGPFLRLILSHPRLEAQHVQQILLWALEVQ